MSETTPPKKNVLLATILVPALSMFVLVAAVGISGFLAYAQWKKASETLMELEALKKKISEKSQADKKTEKEQGLLETEMSKLQKLYEKAKEDYESLMTDRDNLLAQVKLSLEEKSSTYDAVTKAEGERDAAVAAHEELMEKHEETQRELEDVKYQLEALVSKNKEIEEARDRLTDENRKLETELKAANESPERSELHVKAILALEKIEALEKDVKSRDEKIGDLTSAKEKLESTEADLREKLETAQANFLKEASKLEALQTEVMGLPDDLREVTKERDRAVKDASDMHYNMGVLFAENGNYQRAVQEFQKAIELWPNDAQSHFNLGVIFSEQLPDEQRAVEHLRHYIRLNPDAADSNWVHQTIATLQTWRGQDRLT